MRSGRIQHAPPPCWEPLCRSLAPGARAGPCTACSARHPRHPQTSPCAGATKTQYSRCTGSQTASTCSPAQQTRRCGAGTRQWGCRWGERKYGGAGWSDCCPGGGVVAPFVSPPPHLAAWSPSPLPGRARPQVKRVNEHGSFVNSCSPARRGLPMFVSGSDDKTIKVGTRDCAWAGGSGWGRGGSLHVLGAVALLGPARQSHACATGPPRGRPRRCTTCGKSGRCRPWRRRSW